MRLPAISGLSLVVARAAGLAALATAAIHARGRRREARAAVPPVTNAAEPVIVVPVSGPRSPMTLIADVVMAAAIDRVPSVAGGVAFFAILAVFPAISALVSLYGLFADLSTIPDNLPQLFFFLPSSAMNVVVDQAVRIAAKGSSQLGATFLLSLAVALWSANAGVKALFDALNVAFGRIERRNLLLLNVESLVFTVVAVVTAVLSLSAIVVLPAVLGFFGLARFTEVLIEALRWPILLLVVVFVLAALFRYGPSPGRRLRQPSWGVLAGAILWIFVSAAFSWYLSHLGSYTETYGSLGAAAGFMMWLWLSVIAVLLGAELDAVIQYGRKTTALSSARSRDI